ncbi:MAG TPA: hypothetical protein VMI75_15750 [Polyangiaceae bacterium]|nr:hypothetical protein [Polyangiaceae bacterium]
MRDRQHHVDRVSQNAVYARDYDQAAELTAGSVKRNVIRPAGEVSAAMWPPCASTSERVM